MKLSDRRAKKGVPRYVSRSAVVTCLTTTPNIYFLNSRNGAQNSVAMSCFCVATSLRLFIRNFASLELESSVPRNIRPLQRRQITRTARWASAPSPATIDANESFSESNGSHDAELSKPSQNSSLKGAFIDLADLSDESIDALKENPTNLCLTHEKEDSGHATEEWDSSPPTESSESDVQEAAKPLKIRRPGARREEEKTGLRVHYTANPNWSMFENTNHLAKGEGKIRYLSYAETENDNDSTTSSSRAPKLRKRNNYLPVEHHPHDYIPREKEHWRIQKEALKTKLGGEAWNPRKRLSPDAIEGIRALNAQFPDQYNTATLAAQFAVSPEAIRRILKSKWRPNPEEEEDRKARWFNRGKKVWERYSELGLHPPKKWRMEGVDRKDGAVPVWFRKKGIGSKTGPMKGGGIIVRRDVQAAKVEEKKDGSGRARVGADGPGEADWV